jgi:hypothetical protein
MKPPVGSWDLIVESRHLDDHIPAFPVGDHKPADTVVRVEALANSG